MEKKRAMAATARQGRDATGFRIDIGPGNTADCDFYNLSIPRDVNLPGGNCQTVPGSNVILNRATGAFAAALFDDDFTPNLGGCCQ